MNYIIKEIDGRLFKVFPSGSRLLHRPTNPKLVNIPDSSGVYMLTQISTGMKYVGSTNDLKTRAGNYLNKIKGKRSAILHDISEDDLTIELLEDCKYLNNQQRLQLELEWIIKIDSIYPKGFNKKCPVTGKKLYKGVMKYNQYTKRFKGYKAPFPDE